MPGMHKVSSHVPETCGTAFPKRGIQMLRGGAVLCYHALTSKTVPGASAVNIPLEEFQFTVELLASLWHIVPLSEFLQRQRAGRSTKGLVSLTFDDAYASVADLAGDWIARKGIPICLFVTSVSSEKGSRFWWDRVEDVADQVSGSRWERFLDSIGVPAGFRDGHRSGGRFRQVRQWILAEHRGRWPISAVSALDALEVDVALQTAQRAMSFDELARFAARCPVEFGVHTVSHPVLPLLSDDEMIREVAESHEVIRERLRGTVPLLAAPYGYFDARTISCARQAGMAATFSVANRTVRNSDQDGVPRFGMASGTPTLRMMLRLSGALEPFARFRSPESPPMPSETT